MSNAKNQNVDLTKKAAEVKAKVTKLRQELKTSLEHLPRLPNNSWKEKQKKIKTIESI